MHRTFTTTGACFPEDNYMVDIRGRLEQMKKMVDLGKYFTINRARQYGKTTLLLGLGSFLKEEYYVVSLDFQFFTERSFADENSFALGFAYDFLTWLEAAGFAGNERTRTVTDRMRTHMESREPSYGLKALFVDLSEICRLSDKPVVLLVDEVDQASNHQVFFDFLAMLRACYLKRKAMPTFQSVILASVCDIKNLKSKIRGDREPKPDSPWNIAARFLVDLSFSKDEIAGMLGEYESDHGTGMDIGMMAGLLRDWTAGYPFLVSRLCQIIDEEMEERPGGKWTRDGFLEAARRLLSEDNTLFESLNEKLERHPELDKALRTILFTGRPMPYNADDSALDIAAMFGFVKNKDGAVAIANRIFETRLYNRYLFARGMQNLDISRAAMDDKNRFVVGGRLDMRRILERFVVHFTDIYEGKDEAFIEERGRELFLLYLKPIINGIGNYYIEAETRDHRRTDVIVDFRGERFVVEMKIWHGKEYNERGERQIADYCGRLHLDTGYMLSFNFNKNKKIGVRETVVGDKRIIEAVV